MTKSIYCVYWRWFDQNGNELPRKCVTHHWHTSYRRARKDFDEQMNILYSNYSDRYLEPEAPNMDWSKDDGTYELTVVKIFAHKGEREHLRLVLAAANCD